MSRWLPPLLAWLLAGAALLPAQALASERILAYDVEIDVRADGSLDVVEHIRVRAEGRDIRRGIFRDFPIRYRDGHGNHVVVGFEVTGVERDGRPEPWFTEGLPGAVRINTGDDTLLPVPLDTTYTLRYRTTRQLGYFDTHDELYWNPIGHFWDFPIDSGSVEVRLPQAVPVAQLTAEGYAGRYGQRRRANPGTVTAPGVANWTLERPLLAREGLTIVLGFPKGLVAEPSRLSKALWLLRDNLSLLAALAGLLLLAGFCLKRWRSIGRDPRPGVIIARYEPPRDESPAALRYMVRRSYDNTCMSAELLACAVKGALSIEQEGSGSSERWTLRRSGVPASAIGNADERRLLEALLPPSVPRLELDDDNATHIQAAIGRHSKALGKRFQPSMFRHNGGSIAIAFIGFFAVLATTLLLAAASNGGGMPWAIAPLVLALGVTLLFAFTIGAPTVEGRRLLDEIEGFKRYLSVAEQDDLARLEGPGGEGPPPLDAKRFEALLPYAVALDVEEAWTTKFTLAVGSAAAAAATAGIAWYHGSSAAAIGGFTRSIGSALSARIASSASPPGSSSGAGGGGFSGGGGGGGGGGGR